MTIARAERKTPEVLTRELNGQLLKRAVANVLREALDEEKRTVDIAWASEQPYERWYGDEILDCKAASIRLGRLRDGASLLFNHKMDALIGVVESVQIGDDQICRAKVRFDTSADGELRFQQVRNGVLRQVSVGYMVHRMVLEEENDDKSIYRVTDWEPYELSMVTVAADPSVGVGRSVVVADQRSETTTVTTTTVEPQPKQEKQVDKDTTTTQPAAPTAEQLDVKRRDAIIELGVKYASYLTLADVQEACTKGHSVEQVQDLVMKKMTVKHSDTRGAHIGMSEKEIDRYSIARAVRALIENKWDGAGLEREAHEANCKMFGTGSKGVLLPWDVFAKRDFTAGTAGEAGNLIATNLRPDLFADVLRNRLVMGRLGVTMLMGLTSNVDMPRKSTGSSLGFVTEVAALTETQPGTSKVSLTPKRIGGYIEFSKQAVIQSALAVEPMLRQDVMSEYLVQFENAAINGSGSGANPRGIRNTAGIGSVVGGTNGAQINWGHIVGLESACANVNAEPDAASGYLVNTKTRGWTKQTIKATNLPFIWDNGAQPLNGYRAEVTNNVPSNLTKGTSSGVCSSLIFGSNWPMFVMATFGAVEVLVDEMTIAVNGLNRLILNAFIDTGCRRPADFATMDDALTV